MSPDWPLETERLVLRPHAESDLAALHELYGDETVARYLYSGPETIEEARTRLGRYLDRRELTETSGLSAAVTLPDGAYVGDLALWHTDFERREAEIAYVVLPRHQGQGYAVEAARALLDWAFDTAGVQRVVARLEENNAASARVAEKLGLRREDVVLENELLYAIPEPEWRR